MNEMKEERESGLVLSVSSLSSAPELAAIARGKSKSIFIHDGDDSRPSSHQTRALDPVAARRDSLLQSLVRGVLRQTKRVEARRGGGQQAAPTRPTRPPAKNLSGSAAP